MIHRPAGALGRARGRARRRLWAAAVLAAAALAVVPAPAQAAAPDQPAGVGRGGALGPGAPGMTGAGATSLTLSAVTPAVATPGAPVVITGAITPLPGRHYVDPVVRVVRGRTLVGRGDVAAWSGQSGSTGPATGTELARVGVPGTVSTGGRLPFRVELPADALRQRAVVAAVAITLEVTGGPGSSGGGVEVLRTFVGWARDPGYPPLAVSWLVPLTVDPEPALYAADPPARAAAWRAQLGETGKPARLLRAVTGRPVDLAVDPALLGTRSGVGFPTGRATGFRPTTSPPTPAPTSTPATTGPANTGPANTGPSAPASSTPVRSTDAGATGPGATGPGATGPGATATPSAADQDDPTDPDDLTDPVVAARVAFARSLGVAAAGRQVLALPYADPDLAALGPVLGGAATPAGSLVSGLLQAPDRLGNRLGRPVVTGFAWPADGAWPAGREEALRAAYGPGLRTVLVSAQATGATGPTRTAPATGAAGTAVLRWDDRLSGLFAAAASDPAAAALAAQEFVAESATLLMERPSIARSVLVVAPRGLDADPGALASFLDVVTGVPWLRPTPVTQAAAVGAGPRAVLTPTPAPTTPPGTPPGSAPTPDAASGLPPADPAPSPVSGAVTDTVVGQQRTLDNLAEVLPPDTRLLAPWSDLGVQLLSTRWRGAREQHTQVMATLGAGVGRLGQAITVSPQTTNFLADEGVLLVTVVNDLDEPVSGLRIVVNPGNPRMRVVQTPDSVDIEARSKASVPVRLAAVASGLVPLSAWLTTPDGAPVGVSSTIEVRAAPPGAWLYIASGVVLAVILVIGVFRSLRRPSAVRPEVTLDLIEPTPEEPLEQPVERG